MENLREIIVKENVLDIDDLLANTSLDYEETTLARNGYPQHLKYAITADTIDELLEIKETLEELGFEVQELELHKKDGWSLWNRTGTVIREGMYMNPTDSSWYIDIDVSKINKVKKDVLEMFYGYEEEERRERAIEQLEKEFNEDFENIEDNELELKAIYEEWDEEVKFFIDQLPEEGKHRVFVNPNNGFEIEYIVNEQSVSYSYDTHNYKLAITFDPLEI